MAKPIGTDLNGYQRKNEKLLLSLEELVDSRHTALVIVDMQNDFVHGPGNTGLQEGKPLTPPQLIIPDLAAFVDTCRQAGVPVFWIITHHESDIDFPAYKALMVRRGEGPVCREGTKGAELVRDLVPVQGERIFVKHGYDGFTGTDLDICLKNRGIRTLIMSGVGTGTCVAATLTHGFHLGYYIVVGSDLTATVTYGKKEIFFEGFAHHYALVVTSKEIARLWNKSSV